MTMDQLPFIGFVVAAFVAGAWVAYIVLPKIPRPRLPDLSGPKNVAKSFASASVPLPVPLLVAGLIALAAWGAANYKPSPTPEPTPDVVPVVEKLLKVLIVEETAERSKLTPAQINLLNATGWRDYVVSKAGESRVLDASLTAEQLKKEAAWVQEAMAKPRASVPWLLVSNGAAGASVPLPETEAAMIELLKKYGG